MQNGTTRYPTKKQLANLQREYNNAPVKKTVLEKYDISMPCLLNVLANKRCSERIFNKLFKSEKAKLIN
jgi:hypothetical protein